MANELIELNGKLYEFSCEPAKLNFNVKELLKDAELQKKRFKGYVSTPESYSGDKNIRADLRKQARLITQASKKIEDQLTKPIAEFKGNIKKITALYLEAAKEIDTGVKRLDDKATKTRHEVNYKRLENMAEGYGINPDAVKYNRSWDNKTARWSAVERDMRHQLEELSKKRDSRQEKIETITKFAKKAKLLPDLYISLMDQFSLTEILERIESDKKRQQDLTDQKEDQPKLVVNGDKVINADTGEVAGETKVAYLKISGTNKQMNELLNFMRYAGLKFEPIKGDK